MLGKVIMKILPGLEWHGSYRSFHDNELGRNKTWFPR